MFVALAKTYMTATRMDAFDYPKNTVSTTVGPATGTTVCGTPDTAKSTRGWHLPSWLSAFWRSLNEARTRRRYRRELEELDDFMLKDIGVRRDEIHHLVNTVPLDADLIRSGDGRYSEWRPVRGSRPRG